MVKKNDIKLPEGYMENLQERLLSIPKMDETANTVKQGKLPVRTKWLSYLSSAACIAFAVIIGTIVLSTTSKNNESNVTELTADEIMNYLMYDGIDEGYIYLLSMED